MLNISQEKLNRKVDLSQYKAGKRAFHHRHNKWFNRILLGFSILLLIILFLPWTQTVSGKGSVTTLSPEHRPQTIQSPIPGRIERWYVQEGDFVNKGDTIIHISEVTNQYFDPLLVERTGEQLTAKSGSVESYRGKVTALGSQINAINNERALKTQQAANKLQQARLKVRSDSIDLEAAQTNLQIARTQLERIQQLQQEGLMALPDVEQARLKLQETQAREISARNRLLASENEVINAEIEISRIDAEYDDKISKTESDLFTAQSNQFDAEAQVSKLENDFTNYSIRNQMYYILAPQSGYINRALRAGIGETFKEGERLVGIMPSDFQLAVETFVRPLDVPLLHKGEKVRVQFDGWPSIVFSGWENLSFGTYGARVVAVENFISPNGLYRVLLEPDPDDHPWPRDVRIGSGASTLALLEEVPIWYEIWRNLNGFPPNYYQPQTAATDNVK
ncbi:HlyD family efflux transporter periplasmic adaptor subunit [Antarcticibacterium flavum]|uniref:HlyD family efflux transporter periplasmic adaptor subunit n=1 Tax=Antarcticibacterium flavum TaxID=2058175 RepID=A0A5B7X6Q3_9FLAO|nr:MULTISPECIES: biotin/lipoyl-binding protein [Antarcticibacterium]MCM4160689.1 biotin attachment protein [Antarcticibacterium sp. W02-3]QCY71164.1 HlyD family efflux transporter periplasmic adaptor subunit [Antarcticibacterium flavum]